MTATAVTRAAAATTIGLRAAAASAPAAAAASHLLLSLCVNNHTGGHAAPAALQPPAPAALHRLNRQLPWACVRALCTSSSSAAAAVPSQRRARVLDGKAVAAAMAAELQPQVADLSRALNRRPGLAVVLVGDRPDSLVYVTRKQEACRSIGIHCRVLRLPEHVAQGDLEAVVAEVSADRAIDGVLVQLPLPRHLNEEAVMEALDPRKDVDGFHPLNMGRMLMRGPAPRFVPATPLGVVELLSRSGVSLAGRTAVVLGDSNIVGGPIAALLRDAGVALVTTCHRVSLAGWFEQQQQRAAADVCVPRLFGPTPPASADQQQQQAASAVAPDAQGAGSDSSGFQSSQLPAICRTADILVVAVGHPELVRADWVKPGAVVVDVGINVLPLPGQHAPQQQQQQQPPAQPPAHPSACRPQVQLQLVASQGADDAESTLSLNAEYRVVGDVAHDEVAAVASVLTPVPGGVGPMTIAALLQNLLQAARYSAGLLKW